MSKWQWRSILELKFVCYISWFLYVDRSESLIFSYLVCQNFCNLNFTLIIALKCGEFSSVAPLSFLEVPVTYIYLLDNKNLCICLGKNSPHRVNLWFTSTEIFRRWNIPEHFWTCLGHLKKNISSDFSNIIWLYSDRMGFTTITWLWRMDYFVL